MRALTWHGIEDVRITEVPDPRIEEVGTQAIGIDLVSAEGRSLPEGRPEALSSTEPVSGKPDIVM